MDSLRLSARISWFDNVGSVTLKTMERKSWQLRWYYNFMRIRGCTIARQVAERESRHGRPFSTWMDEIRDSKQRRNIHYGGYFN